MIRACIFDLDGTLADSLSSIAYFANMALEKYGHAPIGQEEYKVFVGDGALLLVKRMMDYVGETSEQIGRQVFELFSREYEKDFMCKTEVYEGIMSLLKELKKQGILLGVLSNKPHAIAVQVVEHMFGKGFFDVCYGADKDKPLKPDPAVLKMMLKELHIRGKECLYIGDTGVDMQTGKAGGAFAVGVLWGFRGQEELQQNGADVIVSHPSEIFAYIK